MLRKNNLFLFVFLTILINNSFTQINFLTGNKKEIYHQFAEDIKNNTNIPIQIFISQGSVDNLNRLLSDSFHLAFVQYDVLLYKEIENSDIKKYIKLFLPLYNEEIHLVALNNSKINSLKDLSGKRVGVGAINSGTNITADLIKLKTEIKWINYNLPLDQSFAVLLKDSIDAFFVVGAAPVNILKSLSERAKNIIKLIPIQDDKLKKIYKHRTIESGTYPWLKHDIYTYSTATLLILNSKNINDSLAKKIEQLYYDLKGNLKGIQNNKFSHPKWHQVDFGNHEGIDWPIYKQEYVTAEIIFDWLAYIALLLTCFQIYFVLNKLWKRKHERIVAESISVSAMFISILINCFFAFKNLVNNGMPQFSANVLWIVCSLLSAIIGIGFWVIGSREKNFFRLLKQSLKLEKHEAADLAKSFFRPSASDNIIEILGRIAMIDNEFAKEEQKFIQSFADEWNIKLDWGFIQTNFLNKNNEGFVKLRDCMKKYLLLSPPKEQVSHLADVIMELINADKNVAKEEALIQQELIGQINNYLGKKDVDMFIAVVIPPDVHKEVSMQDLLNDLKKENFGGGNVYISEPYYSYQLANVVCEKFRDEGMIALVTFAENT